jgi:hypothetical protein
VLLSEAVHSQQLLENQQRALHQELSRVQRELRAASPHQRSTAARVQGAAMDVAHINPFYFSKAAASARGAALNLAAKPGNAARP